MALTWSQLSHQKRSSRSPRQRWSSDGSSWRSICRLVSGVCPVLWLRPAAPALVAQSTVALPMSSLCSGPSWCSQSGSGISWLPAPPSTPLRWQRWSPPVPLPAGGRWLPTCVPCDTEPGCKPRGHRTAGRRCGSLSFPTSHLTPGPPSVPSAAGPDTGRQRDLQQLPAQGPAGEGGLRGSLCGGEGGWWQRGHSPEPVSFSRRRSRYPRRRWCWKCCSPTDRRSRSPSSPRTRRRTSSRCQSSCGGQDQLLLLSPAELSQPSLLLPYPTAGVSRGAEERWSWQGWLVPLSGPRSMSGGPGL